MKCPYICWGDLNPFTLRCRTCHRHQDDFEPGYLDRQDQAKTMTIETIQAKISERARKLLGELLLTNPFATWEAIEAQRGRVEIWSEARWPRNPADNEASIHLGLKAKKP